MVKTFLITASQAREADEEFFIANYPSRYRRSLQYSDSNDALRCLAVALLFDKAGIKENEVTVDENGKPVKDENDVEIYISDNLKDVDVATLLIEAAEDHVLTDETKADARSRLKEGYTHKVISPGAHMSFCTADSDDVLKVFNDDGEGISESDKQAQRTQTVAYVLEFVKNLSK